MGAFFASILGGLKGKKGVQQQAFSTPRKRKIRRAKLTKLCRRGKEKKNALWLHIN
jgi:hypothetical protein